MQVYDLARMSIPELELYMDSHSYPSLSLNEKIHGAVPLGNIAEAFYKARTAAYMLDMIIMYTYLPADIFTYFKRELYTYMAFILPYSIARHLPEPYAPVGPQFHKDTEPFNAFMNAVNAMDSPTLVRFMKYLPRDVVDALPIIIDNKRLDSGDDEFTALFTKSKPVNPDDLAELSRMFFDKIESGRYALSFESYAQLRDLGHSPRILEELTRINKGVSASRLDAYLDGTRGAVKNLLLLKSTLNKRKPDIVLVLLKYIDNPIIHYEYILWSEDVRVLSAYIDKGYDEDLVLDEVKSDFKRARENVDIERLYRNYRMRSYSTDIARMFD